MRRFLVDGLRGAASALAVAIAAVLLAGCGGLLNVVKVDPALPDVSPPAVSATAPAELDPAAVTSAAPDQLGDAPETTVPEETAAVPLLLAGEGGDDDTNAPLLLAQTQRTPQEKVDTEAVSNGDEAYDPWEPFNEKMFEFNYKLDRYVMKPVAKVYNVIMPEPFQVLIANGFDNISFVPRTINSLLQGKWGGAGRELSRFLINSTAGIGGLFDAAKYWGIEKSREDFGQTLGVWGVGPGPYLIVPFMEPLTVRDGIGKGVDSFMNPLSYFVPLIWAGLGMKVGEIVNDRALNLELFQGFEESVLDLYSAVRNGYLRRREQMILE